MALFPAELAKQGERNEANLRLTPPCSRELAGRRRRRPRRRAGRRRGGRHSWRDAGKVRSQPRHLSADEAMPLICCSSRPPARTRMAHEMGRALAFDATLRPSPFASGHCRRHRPVAQTR